MKKARKKEPSHLNLLLIIILLLVISIMGFYISNNPTLNTLVNSPDENSVIATTPVEKMSELMPLDIYIQNTDAAKMNDCRATQKVSYKVPKNPNVADISIRILFAKELAKYGTYESVTVSNGIAKINLQSDLTPNGIQISSLSSCEIGHLLSVLKNTLTQYSNIQSVVLYSPKGKIDF